MRNKFTICQFLILAAIAKCFASADTVWTKAIQFEGFNAYGMECKEVSDGNILMTGYAISTDSLSSIQKGFLLKMNGAGELLWKKMYEDTTLMWGTAIIRSDNNSNLLSGICRHIGDTTNNKYDGVIIETDLNGAIKSRIVFDQGGWDAADYGIQAQDSGIAIVGLTETGTPLNVNAWIIKTDNTGLIKWSMIVGDTNMDVCFDIAQTRDHGYIATGYTESTDSIEQFDIWLIKLDSLGEIQWKKTYTGVSQSSVDCGYAVKQTKSNDYIVVGYGENGNRDLMLICTDSLGTFKWQKRYGNEGDDEATSLLLMPDGGFLIAGKTSIGSDSISDIWILRTNAGGDTLWTRKYGGNWSDNPEKISATLAGTFLVAGSTKLSSTGEQYAWVLKLAIDDTKVKSIINSKVVINSKKMVNKVLFGTNSGEHLLHKGYFQNGINHYYDLQGRSVAKITKQNYAGILLKQTILNSQNRH